MLKQTTFYNHLFISIKKKKNTRTIKADSVTPLLIDDWPKFCPMEKF